MNLEHTVSYLKSAQYHENQGICPKLSYVLNILNICPKGIESQQISYFIKNWDITFFEVLFLVHVKEILRHVSTIFNSIMFYMPILWYQLALYLNSNKPPCRNYNFFLGSKGPMRDEISNKRKLKSISSISIFTLFPYYSLFFNANNVEHYAFWPYLYVIGVFIPTCRKKKNAWS